MAQALSGGHDKTVYVALHANHARELTPAARAACKRLIDRGVAMVSQSVLLKGVNDNADALAALMRALVETRIKPYYLHHGDLAPGGAHFRIPIAQGHALMRELRAKLSGLAQPTYVLDIPGAHGKIPVGPAYVEARADGAYDLTDASGAAHLYLDCCAPDG
jgi:lysine 2,3-aminomutase